MTSSDPKPETKLNLEPDDIAAALCFKPVPPSDGTTAAPAKQITHDGYVAFKGYLAPPDGGVHCLYRDRAFMAWLAIPTEDIKFRVKPSPTNPDGPSTLLVGRKAKVTHCQVGEAYEVEAGVWGGDLGDSVETGIRPHGPPY